MRQFGLQQVPISADIPLYAEGLKNTHQLRSPAVAKTSPPKTVVFAQLLDVRAYPPLVNLIDSMTDDGWRVRLAAWELFQFDDLPYGPKALSQTAFKVRVPAGRYRRLFTAMRYAAAVTWTCLTVRPERVIVSDPPSAFLGLCLVRLLRCKVVYFEFDSPSRPASLREKMRLWTVRKLARVSTLNVLPNTVRSRQFDDLHKTKTPAFIVYNFPTSREFVSPSLPSRPKRQTLRVYYHGSFVKQRVPLTVLDALAKAKDVEFVLRPVFPARSGGDSYFHEFMANAKKLGIGDKIFVQAAGDPERLKAIGSSCDVGLAFFAGSSDPNLQTMWGASNKVTQYMAYGLAVIYSSSEQEMIENLAEIGLRCDMHDGDGLAAIFTALISDSARLHALKCAAHHRTRESWTFEREYQKLRARLLA